MSNSKIFCKIPTLEKEAFLQIQSNDIAESTIFLLELMKNILMKVLPKLWMR